MPAQWREGAESAGQLPVLRALMPLVAMMALGGGILSALPALFARELLDDGPDVLGRILSAQAVGGVIGVLWSTRAADRRSPLHLLAVAAPVAALAGLAAACRMHQRGGIAPGES